MGNTANNTAMEKKAFEMAHALLRIAGSLQNDSFKNSFEQIALQIMNSAMPVNKNVLQDSLQRLAYLSKLANAANVVNYANLQVIDNQAIILQTMIAGLSESVAELPDLNLQKIFAESKRQTNNPAKALPDYPAIEEGSSEERQKILLERIEKVNIPNMRFKDMKQFLPEVSERTLRYDIQALVNGGLLQRSGEGGPGTFYTLTGGISTNKPISRTPPIGEEGAQGLTDEYLEPGVTL